MKFSSLYNSYQRYRSLRTHRISSLPVVILMPHSACNCRCVMCDIWKGNQNLKQLEEKDILSLLISLKKLKTQQVLMSGGEALLNPNFFRFCEILRKAKIKISLLSTGLTVKKNAKQLTELVDDIIVSLDGDEALHDAIRNIPGAFHKLREGIKAVRAIDPAFPFTGRTVIHRLNFRQWPDIIDAAKKIGLDQVSFLPADLSSHAFNRENAWDESRQFEVALAETDLEELQQVIDKIINTNKVNKDDHFITESAEKLQMIYTHYAAYWNRAVYPFKKCNAPWVSAVVEADGTVRPCFFHKGFGNIHSASFADIINSDEAVSFRKNLNMSTDTTCTKCVCYLHLSPLTNIA